MPECQLVNKRLFQSDWFRLVFVMAMNLAGLLLCALMAIVQAIPKGGGAGSGGASSGHGSSGGVTSGGRSDGSGLIYYGSGGDSGRLQELSHYNYYYFGAVWSNWARSYILFGQVLVDQSQEEARDYGKPDNGRRSYVLGQVSDASNEEYQRGLAFCNQNPVSSIYPVVDGFFVFDGLADKISMERTQDGILLTSGVSVSMQRTVLSNYPLNQSKEYHTYEFVIDELPAGSIVALGRAAKPYPEFRLPGWHRESVGLHSDDGNKFFDNSYGGASYSSPLKQGDTVSVNYVRSTGIIFYSVNGHKLADAYTGKFDQLRIPIYVAVGFEGPSKVCLKDPTAPDAASAVAEPSAPWNPLNLWSKQ